MRQNPTKALFRGDFCIMTKMYFGYIQKPAYPAISEWPPGGRSLLQKKRDLASQEGNTKGRRGLMEEIRPKKKMFVCPFLNIDIGK